MKNKTELLTALGITVRTVASTLPRSSNLVTVMRCNVYSVATTAQNACGISSDVQLG